MPKTTSSPSSSLPTADASARGPRFTALICVRSARAEASSSGSAPSHRAFRETRVSSRGVPPARCLRITPRVPVLGHRAGPSARTGVRGAPTTRALLEGVGVGADAVAAVSAAGGGGAVRAPRRRRLAGRRALRRRAGLELRRARQSSGVCSRTARTTSVMALELLAPTLGALRARRAFLATACAGSLARAVCGVAAGATRAALTRHLPAATTPARTSPRKKRRRRRRRACLVPPPGSCRAPRNRPRPSGSCSWRSPPRTCFS